jgi:polyferredoxin
MKTAWLAFWAVAITIVGGLLFWRNTKRYRLKSAVWRMGKSIVELLILVALAAFLPALLIAWIVLWICKPIKRPWARAIVGVVSGIGLALCSHVALEILVILGAFGIDLKTGAHEGGFMNCWRKAKNREKSLASAA